MASPELINSRPGKDLNSIVGHDAAEQAWGMPRTGTWAVRLFSKIFIISITHLGSRRPMPQSYLFFKRKTIYIGEKPLSPFTCTKLFLLGRNAVQRKFFLKFAPPSFPLSEIQHLRAYRGESKYDTKKPAGAKLSSEYFRQHEI